MSTALVPMCLFLKQCPTLKLEDLIIVSNNLLSFILFVRSSPTLVPGTENTTIVYQLVDLKLLPVLVFSCCIVLEGLISMTDFSKKRKE